MRGAFVDAELAVLDLLDDLTVSETATVVDTTITDRLPALQVSRTGGGDDRFTDVARVDVTSYATTDAEVRALASAVHERMLAFPHRTTAGVIDRVETDTGPHETWSRNRAVRARRATYRVSVRRRPR
jgi:hypothetical protein